MAIPSAKPIAMKSDVCPLCKERISVSESAMDSLPGHLAWRLEEAMSRHLIEEHPAEEQFFIWAEEFQKAQNPLT